MAYKFIFTNRFHKNFKFLSENEKKQTRRKLILLSENPGHTSLRTKQLKGTKNIFESSVNMDIRIIWHYENDQIFLSDIGHHDILKRF